MDPIDFLFSLERLGMKFGLENINALCDALGRPERAFRSVHIAGTNGKGSVTVMVETALRAAGHHVARYTSPHLVRLEERFVIDGREVTTSALREALGDVQRAIESLTLSGALPTLPTFFECATAAAFVLFRQAQAGIAVLEVGLGGRLDATNVVHPLVCGPVPREARAAIEEICALQRAPIIHATEALLARRGFGALELALAGRHQRDNAAVAVALLDELARQDVSVPDDAIRRGLTQASWPARLERISYRGRDILLDAAHNPAGTRALASYLQEIGWTAVTLLFGAMRDKDARRMLAPLAPRCARVVCTTAPTRRAATAAELAAAARDVISGDVPIDEIDDPAAALERATASANPVVAAGSIFLIGPLRDILR